MELKLSDAIEFPVENIEPAVDISQIENYSHFSAVRLAKKHYEKQGFIVLEGADFENNLVLYFCAGERLFCDEYIKVKLGKAHVTTDALDYSEKILNIIPEDTVKLLLQLCRFCSYTGDPGFPDLIVLGEGGWQLKYVLFDELSPSQKMFLLLSKLADINPGIVEMTQEENKAIKISLSELLASVVGERRSVNIMQGVEENIMEAREKAPSGSSWQDELNYLVNERNKNPLFLFGRWLKAGRASSVELSSLISFVSFNSRHNFGAYLSQLKSDAAFASISGRAEDAMKRRAEYMQKKFGIGQTKSKLLLNFF